MRSLLLLLVIPFLYTTPSQGQIGRLALSPVQKIEQKIGLTQFKVVCSRPSARERKIFGGLVPYDKIWRTGANRNTTLEFDQKIFIGGKEVKAGKYAIYTIPSKESWEFILYEDYENWDVADPYDESKVVAKHTVPSEKMDRYAENFSISFDDFDNYKCNLTISWENTLVRVPIEMDTRIAMDKKIERILSGPSSSDYYSAATYELEAGHDYKKGLEYINKSMELNDKVTWWDYRMKSYMLVKLGRKEEAKKLATEGLAMAKKAGREYGINEFEIILKMADKL